MAPGPNDSSHAFSRATALRVRQIELRTRDLVETLFSGEYHSAFKGQGLEFADLREYQPGDDVRAIDWNVTARRGTPFLRISVEERQLNALVIVDLSASHRFGTGRAANAEIATEIAAILALAATANNDRVALLLVTDRVELFIPGSAGRSHALRLVMELLSFRPSGTGTRLSVALDFATRVLPGRSIVFLISDFQTDPELDPELPDAAFRCGTSHDLVPVRLADPAAGALPDVGMLAMSDPESGRRMIVNTASASVRERYVRAHTDQVQKVSELFRKLRLDVVEILTTQDYIPALVRFFRRRERRTR